MVEKRMRFGTVAHYIWNKNGLFLCLVMGMNIRIIQGTLSVATFNEYYIERKEEYCLRYLCEKNDCVKIIVLMSDTLRCSS